MSELLTPQDVAGVLKISVRAARDLMASGQLPVVDVSVHAGTKPRRRVTAEALEAFLHSRIVKNKETPAKARRRDTAERNRLLGDVIQRF